VREWTPGVDASGHRVNLKSHHRRGFVVAGFRGDLVRLNSPRGKFHANRDDAQELIAQAMMRTRPGLCPMNVMRMVLALWECDD